MIDLEGLTIDFDAVITIADSYGIDIHTNNFYLEADLKRLPSNCRHFNAMPSWHRLLPIGYDIYELAERIAVAWEQAGYKVRRVHGNDRDKKTVQSFLFV